MAIIGDKIKKTRAVTTKIGEQEAILDDLIPDVQYIGTILVPQAVPVPVQGPIPMVLVPFMQHDTYLGYPKNPDMCFMADHWNVWHWKADVFEGPLGWVQEDQWDIERKVAGGHWANVGDGAFAEGLAIEAVLAAHSHDTRRCAQELYRQITHDWCFFNEDAPPLEREWCQGYPIE